MRGFNDQAWVTSALTDLEMEKALCLSASLRRSSTNRWLVVIASMKISLRSRDALKESFDFVFYLDEDQDTGFLKMEDFAKLSAIGLLRPFRKCVYLSPDLMAMKNCDEVFDLGGSEDSEEEMRRFVFLQDSKDTSVFLFRPSMEIFRVLKGALRETGCEFGAYLSEWAENQDVKVKRSKGQALDGNFVAEKYNRVVSSLDDPILGLEDDIGIVNLGKLERADFKKSPAGNLPLRMILNHWRRLQELDVEPLLKSLGTSGLSSFPPICSRPSFQKEPIAIVGMSCRFPGSNNLEEFWNLLVQDDSDGITSPPDFRWRPENSLTSNFNSKTQAGFLKVPVDELDGKFFGVSPKESLFMDPQHRLLLEIIWESLEDASIDPQSLDGTSGSIFLGSWMNDYKDILVHSGNTEFYRAYMGNSIGAMAARISHLLGITGPSIATESGCSSAMVALHLACRSLRNGETNVALAGGVNLLLRPFDKDVLPFVISPDGHCKTFDQGADGFGRAEGCGVLVLKRFSDAVKNGDRIWALLRGTGVSQEGVSKSMGTPTVQCEYLAMSRALKDCGGDVKPEMVSYVEAHGTGTVVGDPLEIAAISRAYGGSNRQEPLVIGSVKTNVGHTESCSGITGIIKVVLSMFHGRIPRHRNFSRLNPQIDLEAIPAIIPMESLEWKRSPGKPRLAGVSSFGITGTDAHAVIEEPPEPEVVWKPLEYTSLLEERSWNILKISAKSEQALEILLQRYKDHFLQNSEKLTFADLCHTGNVGRSNFPHRAVLVGQSKQDLVKLIENRKYLRGELKPELELEHRTICFLFTGQGSQYPGMALQLYKTSPVFQMHFDFCSKILRENYDINIVEAIWPPTSGSTPAQDISRTIYSQTSIFCVEYALLKLWESLGVTPKFVLGHSLGEFCAAVSAGILSVQDALKLVASRSLLIDQLPPGKMLVVKGDLSRVKGCLQKFSGQDQLKLDIAAVNSPEQTVVAGDPAVILEFSRFLTEVCKLKNLVLEATHAFHSRHMDTMLDAYRKVVEEVITSTSKRSSSRSTEIQPVFISGLLGTPISNPAEIDWIKYWVDHTRSEVRFMEASRKAVKELGCDVFIEVGPQPVLTALTVINNEGHGKRLLTLPSMRRLEEPWKTFLTSLGNLWISKVGQEINWKGLDEFQTRKKVSLPHYPFLGKKCWPEVSAISGVTIYPLLGAAIPNPTPTKIFQSALNLGSLEFIRDHVIGSRVIFPGAGFLEMCLAAGHASLESSGSKPSRPLKIENLTIEAPLELLESKTSQVQTTVELETSGTTKVKVFQKMDAQLSGTGSSVSWLTHASATFSPLSSVEVEQKNIPDFKSNFMQLLEKGQGSPEDHDALLTQVYDKLAGIGLKFGASFRSLEKLWKPEASKMGTTSTHVLAKVKLPGEAEVKGDQDYIIHPVVLDAMLQTIMMLKLTGNLRKKLYVPIKIGKFVWLSAGTGSDLYIYAYDEKYLDPLRTENCHAILCDATGHPMALMTSVEFIDTTVKAVESVLEQQTNKMPDLWEEVWRPSLGATQCRPNLEICNNADFLTSEERQVLNDTFNVPDPEAPHFKTFMELQNYCYFQQLNALYDLGWKPEVDKVFEEGELFESLELKTPYRKLFTHYMEVLALEGILRKLPVSNWRVVKMPPSKEEVELLCGNVFQTLAQNFSAAPLVKEAGSRLADVLKGRQSALGILFPEDSTSKKVTAADFYSGYATKFCIEASLVIAIPKWFDYLKRRNSEKKFVFRVLEVGAGTGGLSGQLLEKLRELDINFRYTYTDISAAFFPAAEKKFEEFGKFMDYRKLNIEDDPLTQGFIPEYYDYICASEVIHATKDIRRSLGNIRTLLRPWGRFDLMEQTKVNRPVTFLFGLLEGFWHFQDSDLRQNHCTLSIPQWEKVGRSMNLEVVTSLHCLDYHHSYFAFCKNPTPKLTPHLTSDLCRPSISPASNEKHWIFFHQQGNKISEFLQSKLASLTNRKLTSVTFDMINDTKIEKNLHDLLTTFITNHPGALEGIVYCWSLPVIGQCQSSQEDILRPYFYLLKSLTKLKLDTNPRLIVMTKSATCPVMDGTCELSNFRWSTIGGLTRSFRNEMVGVNCKCIDIPEPEVPEMDAIFYEMWNFHEKGTCSSVVSNGTRYIPKLVPVRAKQEVQDLQLPGGARFQLLLPESRAFQDLQFGCLEHPASKTLDSHDIEIQVKAAALNFRDVFSVLKPTEQFQNVNDIGLDFSGVVSRIGENVAKLNVGDPVFGVNFNGGALRSHVTFHEAEVLPVPHHMTLCEAATLPSVFSTAFHCLIDVAKITSKDIVLVHAASGGVGLAAIELCKHVGARVICTAGSHRKRNFLRKVLNIPAKDIFHSRNLEYSQGILEVTKGQGVTVVLNSLTGEGFKEATLKCCAKSARFVEMSKLNIWSAKEVSKLRPDVMYRIVDLSSMDRKEVGRILEAMKIYLDNKITKPLPYIRFDAVNVREALQYLQKARQIGKVVVVMPEPEVGTGSEVATTPLFNAESTYLITGGLGGIGFTVCQWMVRKHGARNILLAGRSPPSSKVLETISKLQNDVPGSKVMPVQVDVSNYEELKDLVSRTFSNSDLQLPPLRGIMHCAGTLHDGLIENLSWNSFSSTFSSKVQGTLNLHELSKTLPWLEHFVMFSSIATLFGSPGQSNHAAGNAFEDALAQHRHSIGLPALSINWGQWGEVGVATEAELPGIRPFSNKQGLQALEFALRSRRSQLCVLNVESFHVINKLSPILASYIDEQVWRKAGVGSGASSGGVFSVKPEEFWQKYDDLESQGQTQQKVELVQDQLRVLLRSILKLDDHEVIEEDVAFQEMGVDSLMFVEIKNGLQTLLSERVTVNASALRDANTLKQLSNKIVQLIEGDFLEVSDDLDLLTQNAPTAEEVSQLIREDAQLPEHIRPELTTASKTLVSAFRSKVILLTGCSGTLGPYLLQAILKGHPKATQVICLMRSRRGKLTEEQRLKKLLDERDLDIDLWSKVRVVSGDVSLEHLGLSESLWTELIDEVDCVIHGAASVHHVELYRKSTGSNNSDMRQVNIQGTKNVLEFCCSGKKVKPICHISSILAVSTVSEDSKGLSESWPEVSDYDNITTLAYPITKFVGDLLLKEAIVGRGLPGKVFRLPFLSGCSKTGRFVLDRNHVMLRYLFILKTGVMSSNPFPLMILPVDLCADLVVSLFFDENFSSSDILNVTHPAPQLDQEFIHVASKLDYPLPKIVDLGEFTAKVRDANIQDTPFAIFKEFYRSDQDLLQYYTTVPALQRWMDGDILDSSSFFRSPKLSHWRPHFYDKLEPTMESVARDLSFAKNCGWLKKFGL